MIRMCNVHCEHAITAASAHQDPRRRQLGRPIGAGAGERRGRSIMAPGWPFDGLEMTRKAGRQMPFVGLLRWPSLRARGSRATLAVETNAISSSVRAPRLSTVRQHDGMLT